MEANRLENKLTPGVNKFDAKKIAMLAMLSALAYIVMFVGRVPVVLFLKYDPKDVVIAISAFMYGPLSGLFISVVVSLIEMVSTSDTGIWGFIMNVLSTVAFVCPAAYIYKKKRTIGGAVIGLVVGALLMTCVMLLWNYLITPIYMGQPREAVAALLLPVFLPFNLLKAALNGVITVLLYKPVVTALRKAKLFPESTTNEAELAKGKRYGVIIVSFIALVTVILLMLVLGGRI